VAFYAGVSRFLVACIRWFRPRRARPAGAMFGNQNTEPAFHPRHRPAGPGGAMFMRRRIRWKYCPGGTSPPVAALFLDGLLVCKPALRRDKLAGGEESAASGPGIRISDLPRG